MSYRCSNCGMELAGMETCDCPVGQAAHAKVLADLDARIAARREAEEFFANKPEYRKPFPEQEGKE